jgi:hypothetical protein
MYYHIVVYNCRFNSISRPLRGAWIVQDSGISVGHP